MDEIKFNEEECTITIQDLYSGKPLITIYENTLGHITFELTDGEVCAALEPKQVKELIKYLIEVIPHETK